jgi:nitrite reductase/ring-hydroxylating ferredoxin subunit
MSELIKVAKTTDLKPGECKTVTANGQELALCNVDGKFFALDNLCPHQGAPLGEGYLSEDILTCPWHGWQFHVCTGKSSVSESIQQRSFECVIDGDDVKVKLA